jgi:hypothetical protein
MLDFDRNFVYKMQTPDNLTCYINNFDFFPLAGFSLSGHAYFLPLNTEFAFYVFSRHLIFAKMVLKFYTDVVNN